MLELCAWVRLGRVRGGGRDGLVVVDVEFCRWVCSSGCCEGDGNETLAEDVEKD